MLYRVSFADGSVELVEANDISGAQKAARGLYDQPVRKIVVENDASLVDVDDDDDEDEDDADNPADEDDEGDEE